MLVSLGAVSAADVNDTAEEQVLSESVDADTISASISVDDDNNTQESVNDESLLSAGTGDSGTDDLLKADSDASTYSDLAKLISLTSTGGTLTLYKDYIYNTDTDSDYVSGITLSKTIVINGNGHSIDGNSVAHAFIVNADNVILNNLTFVNMKTASTNNIVWNGANGTISNSTLKIQSIYWYGSNGKIVYSKFKDIRFGGTVINIESKNLFIKNSTFENITYASKSGSDLNGFIYATLYAENFTMYGCNFTNINTGNSGDRRGLVAFYSQGTIDNCRFISITSGNNQNQLFYSSCSGVNILNSYFESTSNIFASEAIGLTVINSTFNKTAGFNKGKIDYAVLGGAVFDQCHFINTTSDWTIQVRGAGVKITNTEFIENKLAIYIW